MKSVGIKVLKNKLSSYLNAVRRGEIVLVTDRDEVIAEIRRPSLLNVSSLSRFEIFLHEGVASGAIRCGIAEEPRFPKGKEDLPPPPPLESISLDETLTQLREDRF